MRKHMAIQAVGLLLITFLGSYPNQANAQTRVGLTTGVNIASFSVSDAPFYSQWDQSRVSSYAGPAAGGMVQIDLGGPVFLRFEPMYIQKGSTLNFDYPTLFGTTQHVEQRLKLEFIELPVNAGLRFGSGAFTPYLFMGPNLGYMITKGYSKTDFALEAGLGAGFNLSEVASILVDIRYSAGLTNLYNQPDDVKLASRGVQPMIGFLFLP